MVENFPEDGVPADPTKWSEKSQRSISAEWTKEYRDKPYKCWRCKADAVFSAADQQWTFEVKKANINQWRHLCDPCWREARHIVAQLNQCLAEWDKSKQTLRSDKPFLEHWLEMLESQKSYVFRPDDSRMNMVRKLLSAE